MIVAFSVAPSGGSSSDSVHDAVAAAVRVVRESGMDCSQLRKEPLYREVYRGLSEGDNHYLDMSIAAMAEKMDQQQEREQGAKPEGRLLSYPRSG